VLRRVFGLRVFENSVLRRVFGLRVFENRVLRRIFGPKRDEVTGEWRKLHNEELHDLYCSPSIIRIIKSRNMRYYGQVARMGEKTAVCGRINIKIARECRNRVGSSGLGETCGGLSRKQ
jgi:hypothetical protein